MAKDSKNSFSDDSTHFLSCQPGRCRHSCWTCWWPVVLKFARPWMAQVPASCRSRSRSAMNFSCQRFDLITVLGRDKEILNNTILHCFGLWKCLEPDCNDRAWSSYTLISFAEFQVLSVHVHCNCICWIPTSFQAFAKHWRYLHFAFWELLQIQVLVFLRLRRRIHCRGFRCPDQIMLDC